MSLRKNVIKKKVSEFDLRWVLKYVKEDLVMAVRNGGLESGTVNGPIVVIGDDIRHMDLRLSADSRHADAIAFVKAVMEQHSEQHSDHHRHLVIYNGSAKEIEVDLKPADLIESAFAPAKLKDAVALFNEFNVRKGSDHLCAFLWF